MKLVCELVSATGNALPEPTMLDEGTRPQRVYSSRTLSQAWSSLISTQFGDEVWKHNYTGSGTTEEPYIIDYLDNDRQDAMNFSRRRKWTIAILQSLSAFAVTFSSSTYASGIEDIGHHFHASEEVAILGLSLYVLGFALGPLLWAPLSEVCGRRFVYITSFTVYVAFSVAAPCSPNITSLLVFRFLASAFGASSMTNASSIIVDMFNQAERGVPTGVFVTTIFLGPAFGPIAGGFLNEAQGWRWVLGLIAILSGVVWIPTTLLTPETYGPTILRRRAKTLSQATGRTYISRCEAGKHPKTLWQELSVSLTRPWILLVCEPIVLLTSLYISIVYGTLYMFFAGFPIVFQIGRGWSQGIAGLSFIGVAVGVCIATVLSGVENKRYARICAKAEKTGKQVAPELRLRSAIVGSLILPPGLFLFAWTTYPSVHWIGPLGGAVLFACGLVMVFFSLLSYLIDSYTIYAASVLAANTCLRSFLAAAFPLLTPQMYETLGSQWASSIPAFLVLACLPVPLLFYKYGAKIRSKCKWSAESARIMELMSRKYEAAD